MQISLWHPLATSIVTTIIATFLTAYLANFVIVYFFCSILFLRLNIEIIAALAD